MIGEQNPVISAGPDAVADRALPEIGLQASVIGRFVVPLLNVSYRGDLPDTNDHPLFVIDQRRALCISKDEAAPGLKRPKEGIEQGLLVLVALNPRPSFKPGRFLWFVLGMSLDPVTFER